jgi:hypothetical protein
MPAPSVATSGFTASSLAALVQKQSTNGASAGGGANSR